MNFLKFICSLLLFANLASFSHSTTPTSLPITLNFHSYNSEAREKYLQENNLPLPDCSSKGPNSSPDRSRAGGDGPQSYSPTWESLDSRPLPAWYDQSKIGIFIHWGVYSVPAVGGEWFWEHWRTGKYSSLVNYMAGNYPPNSTYQEFAPSFSARHYNSTAWANLFAKAGAKYVVLTSKHHDGYTLWPSTYSFSWNSGDVGPKRDLIGELAAAVRNTSTAKGSGDGESQPLRFGLYHSLYEWYNPVWRRDKHQNNLTTRDFVDHKVIPEMKELIEKYKPDVLWSDGEWEAPPEYWRAQEFLAWLYNESGVKSSVVTNDRWGIRTLCTHGDFYTCRDRYNPKVLQAHKWENALTLDQYSWGYRRNANINEYLTAEQLITTLVQTVACGGNVLVNVGPTAEGTIPVIQQERLMQMGKWLSINGQAIYASIPWKHQNDTTTPGIWYTTRPAEAEEDSNSKTIYGMITAWPDKGGEMITLGSLPDPTPSGQNLTVRMLGAKSKETFLTWTPAGKGDGIRVVLPRRDEIDSKWAWTLVFHYYPM